MECSTLDDLLTGEQDRCQDPFRDGVDTDRSCRKESWLWVPFRVLLEVVLVSIDDEIFSGIVRREAVGPPDKRCSILMFDGPSKGVKTSMNTNHVSPSVEEPQVQEEAEVIFREGLEEQIIGDCHLLSEKSWADLFDLSPNSCGDFRRLAGNGLEDLHSDDPGVPARIPKGAKHPVLVITHQADHTKSRFVTKLQNSVYTATAVRSPINEVT